MYNGYRNWETWNCTLWLTNEEGTYFYYKGLAEEMNKQQLAESIESDINDNIPVEFNCGLYSDLLTSALSEIDYCEVAEAFMDEDDEEEEE